MIFCEKCVGERNFARQMRAGCRMIPVCPTCGNKKAHCCDIADSEMMHKVLAPIEDLISQYVIEKELPDNYPEEEKRLLAEDLRIRFGLFPKLTTGQINEILMAFWPEAAATIPELFHEKAGIPQLHDLDWLSKHSMLSGSWDDFTRDVKFRNRYHSHMVQPDILARFCTYIRRVYNRHTGTFYRARIAGNAEGYPAEYMSAPPAGESSDGRANARGITCLYLASDINTAFHEVRAGMFDYVTIGEFVPYNRNIVVADLRMMDQISPFDDEMDPLDYAANKPFLDRLNQEMSKAMRRGDSVLEYVPTQYIVDCIKSFEHGGKREYDGIAYKSTTSPQGFNLAIFDPDLFFCLSTRTYEVRELEYIYLPTRTAVEI